MNFYKNFENFVRKFSFEQNSLEISEEIFKFVTNLWKIVRVFQLKFELILMELKGIFVKMFTKMLWKFLKKLWNFK